MKPIIVALLTAGCLWLAACSSNLTANSGIAPSHSTIDPSGVVTSKQSVSVTLAVGEAVPYEIVATGDPMVGSGKNAVTVAWKPGSEAPTALAAFPDEAQTTLGQLPAQGGSDLYLAIYGGLQPSNG